MKYGLVLEILRVRDDINVTDNKMTDIKMEAAIIFESHLPDALRQAM